MATAVCTLAIGIGANTAVFSLIDSVLLRPLPLIKDQQRLLNLFTANRNGEYGHSSYPDYLDYQEEKEVFSGMAAFLSVDVNLSSNGFAERIKGELVSTNYFAVLGVRPELGHDFDSRVEESTVMLGAGLWKRRFAGDPGVIGKTILINQKSFTVIGIMPQGFRGASLESMSELWAPVKAIVHFMPAMGSETLRRRHWSIFNILGRLQERISIDQAQAAISVVAARLDEAESESAQKRKITLVPFHLSRFSPHERPQLIRYSVLLLVVVGLVLLIACVNLANLVLARGAARQKEIAVRAVMGATRSILIRELMMENILLTFTGSMAALLLFQWTIPLLQELRLPVPVVFQLNMDLRIFGFAALLSLGTATLFGLLPALRSSTPDLISALKDHTSPIAKMRGVGLRQILVIAQVGLCMILLIGAALLVRSLKNLHRVDVGFDSENVLVASLDLHLQGYDEEQGWNFYRRLTERTQTITGVKSVSLVSFVPFISDTKKLALYVEGSKPEPVFDIEQNIVGLNYFQTMRISLLQGRSFSEEDRKGAPWVAVINRTMAHRYWPGENPIGKWVSTSGTGGPYVRVIGVVADSKYLSIREPARPILYWSHLQMYELFGSTMSLLVRTDRDAIAILPAVRQTVQSLDRHLPLYDVKTLSQQVSSSLVRERQLAAFLGVLAVLAMILACVGLYGILSFSVTQGLREIGIRMALGAERLDIVRLVIGQGSLLVFIGIGILGLPGAFVLARLLESLLFGVTPTDSFTYVMVASVLFLISLLACFIPARRAARLDPLVALRYE